MIKKHFKTIIITSVITLVPMIAGLALWNKLPAEMPIHFNIHNEVDGYGSKAFVVFGMPLMMLGFHLICVFATKADPKQKNISDKVMKLILYIIPAVSLLMCGMIYPAALGKEAKVGFVTMIFVGVTFILIGNYLPKCKQSYTIGIKLPWTLDDSENWTKTHALAGKLWVICGVAVIVTSFLEIPWLFAGIAAVMVGVPTGYSYLLYKNKKGKGE